MVKKSKKVLAMVLALTMITSVFAGTGAFATQPTGTNAPYKASIETNFYTKDANGVRTMANADEVATVTYYKAGTTEEVQKNALVVGDAYTVDIIQNQDQVKAYGINKKANLLVDLDSKTGEKYLDSTNIELVLDEGYTGGIRYTETFEAMTNSTLKDSVMELAIDVTKKVTDEYIVSINMVNDGQNGKGATFTPAKVIQGEETKFTNLDTDDVYFNLTTEKGEDTSYQYSVPAAPTLVVYDVGKNDITGEVFPDGAMTATADFKEGVNRYKLDNKELQKALKASKDIASFSLTAEPVRNNKDADEKTVTLGTTDWQETGSVSALPGEVVTLTYTGVVASDKVFAGFTAETASKAIILNASQYQYVVNGDQAKTVSFVMPNEAVNITGVAFKDTPKSVSLSNNVDAKAKIVLPQSEDSITITEGETKAIEVAPSDKSQKFINYLNTDVPITLEGYTFKYTGMTAEGNLKFDVSINDSAADKKFPSDQLKGKLISINEGAIIVPVCYDQKVTNNNANVKITSIGVGGKLLTGQKNPTTNNVVEITYSADKFALYKATLGTKELTITTEDEPNKATATIADSDVEFGVLNLTSYKFNGEVKVDINNPGAGTVQLLDKTQKPLTDNLAKPGDEVNVVINVNEGYEFVEASAYKNGKQTESLDLTDNSKEEETNIKRFSFNMPAQEQGKDADDVTIVVELKKSVKLVNETPEDQKETNHGYIKLSDDKATTAMTGDTVEFEAVSIDSSKYMPKDVYVNAYKDGNEKLTPIEYTQIDDSQKYQFIVPADLDADEIKVGATFARINISITNETPEDQKETNHGYIPELAKSANAGDTIRFQALPTDNGIYIPKDVIGVAFKGGEQIKVLTAEIVKPAPGETGLSLYTYDLSVPADLDADEIKVSATFKEIENGWKQLEDGNWTYMKDGQRVTGWQDNISGWEGQWFYFDRVTGVMATGWKTNIPGWGTKWFYFDPTTGIMASNQWVETTNGEWYYLCIDGCMETSKWVRTGNDKPWSYVDADGKAVKDTVVDGYYVDANGNNYDNM